MRIGTKVSEEVRCEDSTLFVEKGITDIRSDYFRCMQMGITADDDYIRATCLLYFLTHGLIKFTLSMKE